MWSLQNLLFTICIALRCVTSAVGVIHVSGYLGSEVNVSCAYGQGYQSYEKYLCKNGCGSSDVLITTSNPEKTKYRIHDDKTARIFTTTISDLHSADAGKYWCGVSRTVQDIYTEVKLKLVQDSCCDTVTNIESYEGYSESIVCLYESQYQNNLKYICRGNRPSTCLQQALITSDNKENGRFRLDDDKVLGTFTVNISSLTLNDSGSYLCGVQRNSDLDVFSAVELEVKEWCCVKSTKVKGTVGEPLTLQCPYPPLHRDNRKFLCKGDHRNNCKNITSQSRFRLEGNVSSSSFSVMITKLEEADAGTYWCGSDSQWRPGNYTKIQLSVVFLQHSSTVPSTVETLGKTSTQITDAGQYVVYTVPPLLLLLLLLMCIFVVTVHKCKHQKVKEDEAVMNRNAQNEDALEEVTGVAENNIYESQEVVIYSNKETSEEQSAGNAYEELGEDEPDFKNVTTEEIFSNGNFHNANIREYI